MIYLIYSVIKDRLNRLEVNKMATLEVYNNYSSAGIQSRSITRGEEYDMVCEFIEYRKDAFKEKDDSHLAIFIETKINNSYPDIVFAEYNPILYENWNQHRNKLSTNDFKILFYILNHRNITSQKIITNLSFNYKDLLLSLENLYDAELIDRKNGLWIRKPNLQFAVKRVEAVEAKISKWNIAIQQALINKSFASESSILYKRKFAPPDDLVDKIDQFGIGVYLYRDNMFSQIKKAKKGSLLTNYNSIYINECIGRIIHGY